MKEAERTENLTFNPDHASELFFSFLAALLFHDRQIWTASATVWRSGLSRYPARYFSWSAPSRRMNRRAAVLIGKSPAQLLAVSISVHVEPIPLTTCLVIQRSRLVDPCFLWASDEPDSSVQLTTSNIWHSASSTFSNTSYDSRVVPGKNPFWEDGQRGRIEGGRCERTWVANRDWEELFRWLIFIAGKRD